MSRRLAVLVWNDAHATLDQLSLDDALKMHGPAVIQTTGYILKSDEAGVLIAGEWLPPRGDEGEAFRSVTFVPRGMVISETAQPRPRKKAAVPAPVA
jgi:hypothetical protein